MQNKSAEKKRILIVNVNWIGDVLFSTPFIRAIRERYPDSYIACLIHPRTQEMLEGNPRINGIIIYDEEGVHKGLAGKLKMVSEIRKGHFDTAFILHRSFTKAFLTFLAGIKERIGYPTKNRASILTMPVEEPDTELHKVEYFLKLAEAVGSSGRDRAYEFFISAENREYAGKFLAAQGVGENDRVAVICPGGNWDPKRWPRDKYAKLSDELINRYGVKVVIAGAKKDVALAADIKGMMKNTPIVSCGETTLKQLAAIFERASLVIANDTGPMHIASAMKAPLIALFGPTSPRLTGPYGTGKCTVISRNEKCEVPCYDFTCTDNKCMDEISVEEVIEAADEILRK